MMLSLSLYRLYVVKFNMDIISFVNCKGYFEIQYGFVSHASFLCDLFAIISVLLAGRRTCGSVKLPPTFRRALVTDVVI